jgi:hypothetical protein
MVDNMTDWHNWTRKKYFSSNYRVPAGVKNIIFQLLIKSILLGYCLTGGGAKLNILTN